MIGRLVAFGALLCAGAAIGQASTSTLIDPTKLPARVSLEKGPCSFEHGNDKMRGLSAVTSSLKARCGSQVIDLLGARSFEQAYNVKSNSYVVLTNAPEGARLFLVRLGAIDAKSNVRDISDEAFGKVRQARSFKVDVRAFAEDGRIVTFAVGQP